MPYILQAIRTTDGLLLVNVMNTSWVAVYLYRKTFPMQRVKADAVGCRRIIITRSSYRLFHDTYIIRVIGVAVIHVCGE